MTQQRKRYSAELKAKVALEAIKGHKTANEIASAYGSIQRKLPNGKSRCSTSCRISSPAIKDNGRRLMKRSSQRSIRKLVNSKWNWIG